MNARPHAVRVWLGWRATRLTRDVAGWRTFLSDLRRTFVPATWLMMRPYGLLGYVPSVAPENKPVGLPDEVALLMYTHPDDYERHKTTVAGRSYAVMHRALFEFDDPARRSRSNWAAETPGEGRLRAFHRPANASGLAFLANEAVPLCVMLAGPTDAPASVEQVFEALGAPGSEAVAICEAGLTLVWLAAHTGASAIEVARTLTQSLDLPDTAIAMAHVVQPAAWPLEDPNAEHPSTAHPELDLAPDSGLCFRRPPLTAART